jgi:CRP-like cAMP-binding protein
MTADRFRAAFERSPVLHAQLHRYTNALMGQLIRTAGCNRVHPIEERCARWLLMTADRVCADQFQLTQEFLAVMLGVRRPSVTVAAGLLQQAGLISYRRGIVSILDREDSRNPRARTIDSHGRSTSGCIAPPRAEIWKRRCRRRCRSTLR